MAEKTTIARPYAKAVFELARDKGDYATWSDWLEFACAVTADPEIQQVMFAPRGGADRVAELLIESAGDALPSEVANFLRLLASNHRLGLLPEIAALYEGYRADAEGTAQVEVLSAVELDEAQKSRLAERMAQRLNREVRLTTRVDPSLLGGTVIRAGDVVIDGSVKGQLAGLAAALMH